MLSQLPSGYLAMGDDPFTQIVYLLKMVIFHIFHGYVRQNPPFPSPKSSWPPMGSMDIHVLQAMTAIRSSCFERLGCLGRPLELWLTPQISQCGNLWKSVECWIYLDLLAQRPSEC